MSTRWISLPRGRARQSIDAHITSRNVYKKSLALAVEMMVICSVRIKWTLAPSTITGRKKPARVNWCSVLYTVANDYRCPACIAST